ncbi:hypothetical protein SIM22_04510 [Bacillus cereus group sp. BfR-BA-01363]|uniref:hypothetical protein n=1 Tax=Bacillus cereus group sp. BfR-BA-01363 TaxID=3094882 RepID=UPI0029C58D0C|nr:hypothetical protein [Bacillus cereus group sp. BfR-BA-01363]MDX5853392.1 hypothetical protein [Bacillus cereus group sp. BfR-BA-01363]
MIVNSNGYLKKDVTFQDLLKLIKEKYAEVLRVRRLSFLSTSGIMDVKYQVDDRTYTGNIYFNEVYKNDYEYTQMDNPHLFISMRGYGAPDIIHGIVKELGGCFAVHQHKLKDMVKY